MIKLGEYVLVTTVHRGVFCGAVLTDNGRDSITLNDCRNIISWTGRQGFLGLAAVGPEKGSRLGAVARRVTLYDVTSVTHCTDEAREALAGWPNAGSEGDVSDDQGED